MWRQMECPSDPELYEIAQDITAYNPDLYNDAATAVSRFNYAGWYANTMMGAPGYSWAKTVTEPYTEEFPSIDDTSLRHATLRRARAAQLCQTAIRPVLQEAGIVSCIDTQNYSARTSTQYHTAYPALCNLLQPLNQALESRGRKLRFDAFDGEHYPETYFMDRFAEDGTFLISTNPRLNEHDLMYHGLGWIALPDSIVIDGFRAHARGLARLQDPAERVHKQTEYMQELEKFVNVIYVHELMQRPFLAEILAQLSSKSPQEVLNEWRQHLYPQQAT